MPPFPSNSCNAVVRSGAAISCDYLEKMWSTGTVSSAIRTRLEGGGSVFLGGGLWQGRDG